MEALCFAGPAATARAAVQRHAPASPSPTVKLLSRRRCSCPSSRRRPCHKNPVLPSWEFASLSALTGISRPSGAFLLTAAVMQRYSVTAPACHFLRGPLFRSSYRLKTGDWCFPGAGNRPDSVEGANSPIGRIMPPVCTHRPDTRPRGGWRRTPRKRNWICFCFTNPVFQEVKRTTGKDAFSLHMIILLLRHRRNRMN